MCLLHTCVYIRDYPLHHSHHAYACTFSIFTVPRWACDAFLVVLNLETEMILPDPCHTCRAADSLEMLSLKKNLCHLHVCVLLSSPNYTSACMFALFTSSMQTLMLLYKYITDLSSWLKWEKSEEMIEIVQRSLVKSLLQCCDGVELLEVLWKILIHKEMDITWSQHAWIEELKLHDSGNAPASPRIITWTCSRVVDIPLYIVNDLWAYTKHVSLP